ncbi:unnamed protein product [Laminaria digitata]
MDFGDFDLTPLGERRPRLPLQRKVKQLQRPWQSASAGARVVPTRFRWASSQQRNVNKESPVARPRSGAPTTTTVTISRLSVGAGNNRTSGSVTSRRRPSTGPPQAPSRHQGKTHARPSYDLPASSKGSQPAVRWDGTAAASTPRGHARNNGGAVRNTSGSYCRPSSGPPSAKLAEKLSARQVFPGDARTSPTLHSPLSSPSFFKSSVATETSTTTMHDGGDAITDPQRRKGTSTTRKNLVVAAAAAAKSTANGNNSLRAATNTPGGFKSASLHPAVVRRRPSTASGSSIHGSLDHVNGTSARPQTVGAINNASWSPLAHFSCEGFRDDTGIDGVDGDGFAEGQLMIRGTESLGGGGVSTSCGEEEGRGGPGSSSVGGRVSVSVVLPVLEKENDARDEERFQAGSTVESPGGAIEQSASVYSEKIGTGSGVVADEVAGKMHAASNPPRERRDLADFFEDQETTGVRVATKNANIGKTGEGAGGYRGSAMDGSRGNGNVGRRSAAVLRTQSPYIGALGYYVGEDSGSSRRVAKSSLHGKALVGSHHCYTAGRGASKRPYTPAITPGEQPYGASHPLSPTSMGSPPRRHRNSNWGEEGTRLALEEEENSRRTAPFIVSGTMLGWKLSTRGRKKSLEDSLKASDYSDHHLIPIYGFRCNNNDDDYNYGGGTTGTTIADEERRVELRRLEARALAAERTALERRSKAEGGAGGAAFARAMSRRALARAELVQKMGDVFDVRKDNVCRGSSPEVIRKYRKHVRDRLHVERVRRRTVRGLPARRPTRITAVTSRADLAGSDYPASDDGEGRQKSKARAKTAALADCSSKEEEELGIEPYLLLVRAKHRQENTARGGKAGVVPFCTGCLGGCKGSCSHP